MLRNRSVLSPSLLATLFLGVALRAQCTPAWLPGNLCPAPEGYVFATTTWDPDGPAGPAAPLLLAGGRFTVGSLAEVSVAAYDGTQWLPFGASPASYVYAFTVFNGQLVAATASDGGTRGVSIWNGTSWQSLGAFYGSEVNALCVYQGALYAGGGFSLVNSAPAANLARWDGSSWSAVGSGLNGTVRALAVFNSVLYVGGQFNQAGGLTSLNLAVWNGSAWAAQPAFNGQVESLAARNGTTTTNSFLFAGGTFSSIGGAGGLLVDKVARFSPATNSWSAMGALDDCRTLMVRSTGLTSYEVLAGNYTQSGSSIRRWNGTAWALLGAVENGLPNSLTYYAGQYVQGTGSAPDGAAMRRFVANAWQAVAGPGFEDTVDAVLDGDGDVFIGGDFGVRRGTSNAWTAVGGAFQGKVSRFARMANGDLIAAGSFAVAGGIPANNIARWNGATWSPLGLGVDDQVLALLPLPNGDLLVGGLFTHAGGAAAPYIARWNGSAWSDVGGGCNGPVHALAAFANGEVVAGGEFTAAGSFLNTCWRVARWNGTAWSPLGAAAGFNGPVDTLAVEASGSLLAAGAFTYHLATQVAGLARWNGTIWSAAGSAGLGVTSLAPLPNGEFYAGYANAVLRMPAAQAVASGIVVRSMARTAAGILWITGDFTVIEGLVSSRVAQLAPPCPATATPVGAGCAGVGGLDTLVATDLPWLGATFRATGSGLPSPALVLVVTGFAELANPLPLAVALPQALPGCNLLVAPDAIDVLFTTGGAATSQLAVPMTGPLVGVEFYQQMVPIQVDAMLTFLQVTASNALHATIGAL